MKLWIFIYATSIQIWNVWTDISLNTDSNLPGAYIFRSVQGLCDVLLLIYRRAPPAEGLVGVYSIE